MTESADHKQQETREDETLQKHEAHNAEEETRTFHLSCHCNLTTISFTLLVSCLPLPVHFCHCGICRHTHGTLCSIHAPIPNAPIVKLNRASSAENTNENNDDDDGWNSLTSYKSSTITTRYFCSNCGAHMVDSANKLQYGEANTDADTRKLEWCVAASLIRDISEDDLRFWGHIFLGSTGDAGLAGLLRRIGGRVMEGWRGNVAVGDDDWVGRGDWDWDWDALDKKTKKPEGAGKHNHDDKLKATCHCGGVEMYISRPRNDSVFVGKPGDMLPRDKSKWYALHDVCTSCRLLSSSAITSWIFPEITHIALRDGSPYPSDGVFGTAKKYVSSPGVSRTFCGTCGALVSYACEERPSMVDIGAGLLQFGDDGVGLRGKDWLEWRMERVAYEEDARWTAVLESLKEGLKEWA